MKKLLLLLFFVSGFAFAQPSINTPDPYRVCDDNGDGFAAFDLNIVTPTLINESGTEVAYYRTLSDSQADINRIDLLVPFVNTIPFNQIIYIRAWAVADSSNPSFTTLGLVVNQKPVVTMSSNSGCVGNAITFVTNVNPPGDYSYSYSTPQGVVNPGNVSSFTSTVEGYYTVTVIDNVLGCVSNYYGIYASFIPLPTITLTGTSICDSNPALITASVNSGNTLNYLWTVPVGANDPGNVSSFSTSTPGTYTVAVFDNGTGCTSNQFSVTVNNQTNLAPTFSTIPPSVCANYALPTISDNGIAGTWSPTVQNTGDYTFTPNLGQCGSVYTTFLTVESGINANFAPNMTQTSNTSFATFDLTSQNSLINNDSNAQFRYFPSYNDALNNINEITNANFYTNTTNPQTIGVRVFNLISSNCDAVTYFTIEVNNVNNVYIPDANFRNRLIALGVDTNGDNEIQLTEAAVFTNEMDVSNSQIANLTGIEAFYNITSLRCNNNNLTGLNINSLTNLVTLDCSYNQITTLSLDNLSNLKYLYCNANALTALNVSNLTVLEELNFTSNLITTINVDQLAGLKKLICSYNQISALNVSNLSALERVEYAWNYGTSLTLANLPQLKYLDCSFNFYLSNLNVTNLPLLEYLDCKYNAFTNINLSEFSNLNYLDCASNQLNLLSVTGLNSLATLYANNNGLVAVDLSDLPLLTTVNLNYNQLNNINLTNANSLAYLYCSFNQLTSLNLASLTGLNYLSCQNNQLAVINFEGLSNLSVVQCDNNLLTSLDFSTATSLVALSCSFNNLNSINIKNGNPNLDTNAYYTWSQNPLLTFVCADEGELTNLNQILTQSTNVNIGNIVFNTYCTFVPGGSFNTITGQIKLDVNNNGCDTADVPQAHLKVSITDGITNGATFTDANGNYKFYTQTGTFNISPEIDNPNWFNFSPTNATVSFGNLNNTSSQDFCIVQNAIHQDLEIVVEPIDFARPGFAATYKITYKNKGNLTTSGFLNLTYNNDLLDFVSATTTIANQNATTISWTYNNLLPFESRSIYVTFNVNSSTATPPVNIGSILNFTAFFDTLSNDENPADNQFVYSQTVVDNYISNAITCLEGSFVSSTQIGDYLHYNIRFENTGSYLAENVVLKNVMDAAKYDISSLQVLSASHPVYTIVSGNLVEFIFENIDLQTPSGNPPVGGHGDILFKIRTKETLSDNDSVIQKARVYFDYKLPITLNDAETTFGTLGIQDFDVDNSIKIYPNPTNSIVNIISDFSIRSIELFDVQGRILETILATKTISTMDISSHANGIYFLKIKTDKGTKVQKLIKK
ncbi:leucine-rich repeat domain-containing protein [Flavobacterium sp. BFFFF1]|uniref:DUF7619 domain-containing protein n=1 Tax=Flavobacterium sp. BFFFF1 TaxID=2015557 RepID=UPI0025C5DFF8|nr:leucine-rich repeat domain-containing protein [Flavobacterium sp. BFFFF1]